MLLVKVNLSFFLNLKFDNFEVERENGNIRIEKLEDGLKVNGNVISKEVLTFQVGE